MKQEIVTAETLDGLTTQIKIKLVENRVLTNTFNRNFNQNSVEIGQMLTQAKNLVKHGQFSAWLAENFKMTDRTARNYMQVARYFGVNSTFKTENVFRFQPAALIELTKISPAEVQKFLAENPNAENLSVRKLQTAVKIFKQENTVTIDVDAEEIQPTTVEKVETDSVADIPKLPALTFEVIPAELQDAAAVAQINISIDLKPRPKVAAPADGVLLTRINFWAMQKFSALAECVIFSTALDFVRSDNTSKKIKAALWYFGGDSDNFKSFFGKFGIIFYPQKNPSTSTDDTKL